MPSPTNRCLGMSRQKYAEPCPRTLPAPVTLSPELVDGIMRRYRTGTAILAVPTEEVWAWQRSGNCHGYASSVFFPSESLRGPQRHRAETEAKRICSNCPVRVECANYALAHHEPHGIWGGTTPKERALIAWELNGSVR
ncbi:WhiB family transcriptional regulator [Rhodococcus sp. EPR-157]|uniref:WhiB family transcriptional regulator n=2 Tax=Rhodococcus TaxID=1827 RepID=UPI002F91835E